MAAHLHTPFLGQCPLPPPPHESKQYVKQKYKSCEYIVILKDNIALFHCLTMHYGLASYFGVGEKTYRGKYVETNKQTNQTNKQTNTNTLKLNLSLLYAAEIVKWAKFNAFEIIGAKLRGK